MANLETKYLGLTINNPIIVGSCGLTGSVDRLKEIEACGAGAVVLKSLFEEQISLDVKKKYNHNSKYSHFYPEVDNYIMDYTREHNIEAYIDFVKEAKKNLTIPVIASINCISASEWVSFARRIEDAGADALELNVFVLPSDPDRYPEENEDVYFDVANEVKRNVSIPVSIKISPYFSSLAHTVKKISWTGVSGIVMFNRFYSPDIDIREMKLTSSSSFSHPDEITNSLKWVAMLSGTVDCDIASSTGVHDGEGVVKQLLAGAKAVQVVSTLYKNGIPHLAKMLRDLNAWMDENRFDRIEDFRGKLSFRKTENTAAWERVQFMKYYGGVE